MQTKMISSAVPKDLLLGDKEKLCALVNKRGKSSTEWIEINNILKGAFVQGRHLEMIEHLANRLFLGEQQLFVFLNEYLQLFYYDKVAMALFENYMGKFFFTIGDKEMLFRVECYFRNEKKDLKALQTFHSRLLAVMPDGLLSEEDVFRILSFWEDRDNSADDLFLDEDILRPFSAWMEKEQEGHPILRKCLRALISRETDAREVIFLKMRLLKWFTMYYYDRTRDELLISDAEEINALISEIRGFARDIPQKCWGALWDVWHKMKDLFTTIDTLAEHLPFKYLQGDIQNCLYMAVVRDEASRGQLED